MCFYRLVWPVLHLRVSHAPAWMLATLAACAPNPFGDGRVELGQPLGEWGQDDLSCGQDTDCFSGEVCESGTCQIERCAADLRPAGPPLGAGLTVARDDEFAFADSSAFAGSYWVDAYQPDAGFEYAEKVAAPIVDLAGGRFVDDAYESYAVAMQGRSTIVVPGVSASFDALEAIAIAAGDIDGDGLDEVVALGADFAVALCDVDLGACEHWKIDSSGVPLDVTAGDIDGDGCAEPVLLLEVGGVAYAASLLLRFP